MKSHKSDGSMKSHKSDGSMKSPPKPKTHTVSLTQAKGYPERGKVNPNKIPWDKPDPSYAPVSFTAQVVKDFNRETKKNGWADPEDPLKVKEEVKQRGSYTGPLTFDGQGRPLNPVGRTGMCGRGLLGKWGPNYAADPIVTRYDPSTGKLQMVAIERADNKQWAIPGGMVDAGEAVSTTLRREFTEEAANVPEDKREEVNKHIEQLFDKKNGKEVYKGYVDDPRNTDNAWMETTAFHFHCDDTLASELNLGAGDDATNVKWLHVDPDNKEYQNLYASHKSMVDTALKLSGMMLQKKPKR